MLDQQKQKKVRKFLRFYLAVRKIVCTFAEDLAALGNLRSGVLIALAGKIIAEDLAALGNLISGALIALAGKSLQQIRDEWKSPWEGLERGLLTTRARGKQPSAPVLSYHRQGLFLRII